MESNPKNERGTHMSCYLSEMRLKYGEGFQLKDWRKIAYEACEEVDRLRVVVNSNVTNAELWRAEASKKHRQITTLSDALDLAEKALEGNHDAIDRLFARLIQRDDKFFPSKSGQPWAALIACNMALSAIRAAREKEAK